GAAMRHRFATIGVGVMMLAGAVALSSRIGAEFVPQLDEGSLVIEARRLPGVALSESVQSDLRLEAALKEIPEVDHIVSRIGAPRIATDPMGFEQSDVYVSLKDRSTWRKGMTREKLAAEITEIIEHELP